MSERTETVAARPDVSRPKTTLQLCGGPHDGERFEQEWLTPTVRIPEGRYIRRKNQEDETIVYYDWQEEQEA